MANTLKMAQAQPPSPQALLALMLSILSPLSYPVSVLLPFPWMMGQIQRTHRTSPPDWLLWYSARSILSCNFFIVACIHSPDWENFWCSGNFWQYLLNKSQRNLPPLPAPCTKTSWTTASFLGLIHVFSQWRESLFQCVVAGMFFFFLSVVWTLAHSKAHAETQRPWNSITSRSFETVDIFMSLFPLLSVLTLVEPLGSHPQENSDSVIMIASLLQKAAFFSLTYFLPPFLPPSLPPTLLPSISLSISSIPFLPLLLFLMFSFCPLITSSLISCLCSVMWWQQCDLTKGGTLTF